MVPHELSEDNKNRRRDTAVKVPEKRFSAQNHYRRWKVDSLW